MTVATDKVAQGLKSGDSVAVNGCCLTAVENEGGRVGFDMLEESIRLTNFQAVEQGMLVNLERALPAGGRMGGHFVSGHIDAVGEVAVFEQRGKNWYLRVVPPRETLKWVAYKGSIALDGVSLTVADVDDSGFGIWLIPHTLEVTNMHKYGKGALVNLEFDILAKYAEKILMGERDTHTSPYSSGKVPSPS